MQEIPKLLIALDVLGSPLRLLGDIGTSLADLYAMPAAAARQALGTDVATPRSRRNRALAVAFAFADSTARLLLSTVFGVAQAADKSTGALHQCAALPPLFEYFSLLWFWLRIFLCAPCGACHHFVDSQSMPPW